MYRILLVEDDTSIVKNLSELLRQEGFETACALNCNQTENIIATQSFDLVLLDVLLPDGNGFSLCKKIKSITACPVIFLTASADEFSVVTGLDIGADDYIEKPYRPRELISRIKSVLRRTGKIRSMISIGNVSVDMDKGIVTKNGKDVFLSALEYRLFLVFLNNPGVTLTRNKLLSEIWDIAGDFVNDNTLTVYIKRLREKIEDDVQNPAIILTVRGIGYKLGEQK
ncbi:MAG: response regulator transcription factor [Clostridia bacterium]|nr:response regulator transcription factor [Clostridia bacterium]MBR6779922.1 response regulator transcription factor [Clostridia bacterium]